MPLGKPSYQSWHRKPLFDLTNYLMTKKRLKHIGVSTVCTSSSLCLSKPNPRKSSSQTKSEGSQAVSSLQIFFSPSLSNTHKDLPGGCKNQWGWAPLNPREDSVLKDMPENLRFEYKHDYIHDIPFSFFFSCTTCILANLWILQQFVNYLLCYKQSCFVLLCFFFYNELFLMIHN